MSSEELARLEHRVDTASDVVREYITITDKGPSEQEDGRLRYNIQRRILKGMLSLKPIEENLEAYARLLGDKYIAIEAEDYKRAAFLSGCQKKLETRLYPFKDDDDYIAMQEFLLQKRMSRQEIQTKYERALLYLIDPDEGQGLIAASFALPDNRSRIIMKVMEDISTAVALEFKFYLDSRKEKRSKHDRGIVLGG